MSLENYCTRGIGFQINDPICHQCTGGCKEKRILSGGPDIAGNLMQSHVAGTGTTGLTIPDSVKTKIELSEYLSKVFTRGSAQYKVAYAEYSPKFEMGKH
jgi:hypothetical protein